MASPDRGSGSESHGIALPVAIRLVCHGCGHRVPLDAPRPFRCPHGERRDDVDHVLRRVFDPALYGAWGEATSVFRSADANPFRRYRSLFYSYEVARAGGMTDSAYLRILDRLEAAVHQVDGRGFLATPFTRQPELAATLDLPANQIWVKDETGNVSGSHKARHLMGVLLWLEVARRLEGPLSQEETAPRLAIASCGNAALAAAVLARAAGRPLDVFVPPNARPRVLARLHELEAHVETCPRRPDEPTGDPCFHRFLAAWADGALPFSVQGKRNGLAIEGGSTLIWEIVSSLVAGGRRLDHLFIQVGGGALAAACVEGLQDARALGLIDHLPRIHTVQTESAWPLRRAWRGVASDLLGEELDATAPPDLVADERCASVLRDQVDAEARCRALDRAVHRRYDYMWSWETEPRSIAYGILDDETYDWLSVTAGMLATGGVPIVVSEETLAEAHRLGREHTGIEVEPTGTAGLAGLLEFARAGMVGRDETTAVLFTGIER